EDNLFEVAPFLDEVLDGFPVRYANHVLFNDGPVVKHAGDIVAGRTNDLDPALKGLVIRFGPHEGWQKRMMNVDDLLRVSVHKRLREDLHVACEDNEIHPVSL